jgi:hypothetical protein
VKKIQLRRSSSVALGFGNTKVCLFYNLDPAIRMKSLWKRKPTKEQERREKKHFPCGIKPLKEPEPGSAIVE